MSKVQNTVSRIGFLGAPDNPPTTLDQIFLRFFSDGFKGYLRYLGTMHERKAPVRQINHVFCLTND